MISLNKFKPRDYQIPPMDAILNKGYKRVLVILPRRAGKDVMAFNLLIRAAIKKVGVYYYVFPTYSQAKKVIWTSVTNDGDRFLDYIPHDLVKRTNSQEMIIELTNGSIIQLVGSDHVDCFDDQTQILTQDGWKHFYDLKDDDKVGTLRDGYLVYQVPFKRVEYDYDGLMYCVNNYSIDIKVTPHHRFWVRSSKGVYKFKNISDPTIKHDSIPAFSNWEGNEQDTFVFPPMSSTWVCGKGREVIKNYNRSMPMEDFVKLLGIFLAEGSTYSDEKTYRISIAQVKKNIRADIENLLNKIGINYQAHDDQYTFEDKQMYVYFSQFGKQPKRFIPKDIKNLSPRYLSILFQWLVKGDGSIIQGSTFYWSTSKQLIDDIQEIIIKLGFSSNITIMPMKKSSIRGREINYKNTLYQIRVRTSQFKRLTSSKKEYIHTEHYKGKVYCVSVDSGVIKVRRNGKEYWSGNSLVGTNPQGIIFSEYALQDPRAYVFLRPILVANNGFAMFISTPRSRNHLYDMYQIAKDSKDWFVYKLDVTQTKHISLDEIEKEKNEGLISEDMINQEYFVSFESGVEGAYYAKYIDAARFEQRIGFVPFQPGHVVHTAWDIGVSDSTTLIFFQLIGQGIYIIDYYENSKEGLEHYVNVLKQKNYTYGKHIGPHDIAVKEWGSGMTRIEKARHLGITFTIAPMVSIEDGIEVVRSTLPRFWFDEHKAKKLIHALENYRQEYDHKRKVYRDRPLHDWSSHACDAVRYLCLSLPKMVDGMSATDLEKLRNEALYGDQYNVPFPFRDPGRY